MKKWITAILLLLIIIGSSCVYHNTEDLYLNSNQNAGNCYTDSVTYNTYIKSFFDSKCINCHFQGGTFPALDNFTDAHNYSVTPGNDLYTKVSSNHKNSNASDCEIAHIQKWVDSGANQ